LDLRKRKETQLSEGRIDSPPTYLKVKTALQLHKKYGRISEKQPAMRS
jgi:hypothetical protein